MVDDDGRPESLESSESSSDDDDEEDWVLLAVDGQAKDLMISLRRSIIRRCRSAFSSGPRGSASSAGRFIAAPLVFLLPLPFAGEQEEDDVTVEAEVGDGSEGECALDSGCFFPDLEGDVVLNKALVIPEGET